MFEQMVKSFHKTSAIKTAFVAYFDDNDDKLDDYHAICKEYEIASFSDCGRTLTQCFNDIFYALPKFDYYHLTNDDVVYKTDGWDEKFLRALEGRTGIAYGNDMLQGENLPTFPFISGDIARALGWLQQPLLTKLCGDQIWKEIGNAAHCLHYVPEVIIEHRHFINNKRENDDPEYLKVYSKDRMKFANWYANNAIRDFRTVRRLVNGGPDFERKSE